MRGWRLAFDDAAVIADDLGDQRKAEARAVGLGGDERIEQVRHQIVRDARAVVAGRRTRAAATRALARPAPTARTPGRKAVESRSRRRRHRRSPRRRSSRG